MLILVKVDQKTKFLTKVVFCLSEYLMILDHLSREVEI